jgi:hypothetical protein
MDDIKKTHTWTWTENIPITNNFSILEIPFEKSLIAKKDYIFN